MSFIGEIKIFAGNFEPEGWMFCDGRTLSSTRHPLLFSIVGIMYGGDDQNFNLPNLNKPDLRYIICCDGEYPVERI
jgi:microcystin-dependent protein